MEDHQRPEGEQIFCAYCRRLFCDRCQANRFGWERNQHDQTDQTRTGL